MSKKTETPQLTESQVRAKQMTMGQGLPLPADPLPTLPDVPIDEPGLPDGPNPIDPGPIDEPAI